VDVQVSKAAGWYLRKRGGRLYVWTRPIGGRSEAAILRHTTRSRPRGVEFDRVDYPGLELWFEEGMLIDGIKIGMTLLPPGVQIRFFGMRYPFP
jgi:hypothetical protein